MKNIFILLALLAVPAYATNNTPPPEPEGSSTSSASATSSSSATSDASASAEGQGGNASVSTHYPNNIKLRNVPSVGAPDVYPSAPCAIGDTGSINVLGFAGSLGKIQIDQDCVNRDEIRLAGAFGWAERALLAWCSRENMVKNFGSVEKCLEYEREPQFVTVADDSHIDQRFLEQQIQIEELKAKLAETEEKAKEADKAATAARARQSAEPSWKKKLRDYELKSEK